MKTTHPNFIRQHPLWAFFILTYALNISITVTQLYILKVPQTPPVAILQVLTPSISAVILTALIGGKDGILKLLSGFTRWKISPWWYLAAFMMTGIPLLIAIIYILLGNPVRGLLPGTTFWGLASTLVFTVVSGPLSEEAGWRGFALPRLQARFNALQSSLILGVLWACWHIPFYFEPGYAAKGMPFPIYLVVVIGLAILFTWIYNNSQGSLLLTMLAHFFFNFSSAFLVQRFGLLPPMMLYSAGGGALGLMTIVVIVIFGPEHLSRKTGTESSVYQFV